MKSLWRNGKTSWWNENTDNTINVYDGRRWIYGANRDEYLRKGNIVVNKRISFEDGTITHKEVHFMARVTQIQVPLFAVEATVGQLLRTLPSMNGVAAEKVWNLLKHDSLDLSRLVTIPCDSEAYATSLASLINADSPIRTVRVNSFTDYTKVYDVEIDAANNPVSCTCPDFVNRHVTNPNHVCKHMQRVSLYPKRYGL